MKSNLVRLLAVGSLVVGGSVMAASPASAVQISLANGDFLNIATYGVKYTGEGFTIPSGPFSGTYNGNGAVVTKAEFDTDSTLTNNFVTPGNFATADLTSTNISEILSSYTTGIGVAKVKSLDLLNTTWFQPTTAPDFAFDPTIINNFNVLPAFGDFVTIDIADAETPDLAIRLLSIKTTQETSLLTNVADVAVGFTGQVEFVTTASSGLETVLGTGSFKGTFPGNGTPTTIGGSTLSFTVTGIPESSPVSALVGFGLVGSAFALKRKARLN